MDITIDRDGTAIGSLFQQIINDMKNTSPLWEDFVAKATKLHMCLRAAIQAIAAYLDAFQKIADAATNSKGASKEIGTALTRVCLRHKAVETRMKTFTSAIMDCLIIPLQEKLEDWKRQCAILDKEHAKEYKKCRTELKKRSSDTLRLQKKARKGQSETIQNLVDSSMHDVTMRRVELEEVEKKSLRAAMIEERTRYCTFVNMLQPVVREECEVMSELGHLQEAMQSIALVTKDPNILPQSSEEIILETKTTMSLYPESPGGSGSAGCSNSLGSRKSSVCSISSMNSSGSSGSPGHQYQRSLSQLMAPTMRLKPGESSDSGFCSSPALTSQASTVNQTHAVSTWPPHTQDVVSNSDRPHTISSAYEKGHQRPALTVYTFQSPENSQCSSPTGLKSPATMPCRPPLPIRCSSLERPLSATGTRNTPSSIPRQCPSPIPAHITKEHPQLQPTYVNMSELASMAALKITNNQQQQQQMHVQQQQHQQLNSPVSIASSLVSSDSSATNQHSSPDISSLENQTPQNNTPQTNNSPQTPIANNSNLSSCLDIHNIGESVATTPTIIGMPTFDGNNIVNNDGSPNSSGGGPGSGSSTNNNDNKSNDNTILSPESDIKCKGSVLDKKSMFENLEKNQSLNNNPPPPMNMVRTESIYGKRNEEIYKSAGILDRDTEAKYEDSIEELNNLIGELDSFQRQHESFMKDSSTDTATKSTSGTTSSSSPTIGLLNGLSRNNYDNDIDYDLNDKLSNVSNLSATSSTTLSSLNDTNLNDINYECYNLEITKYENGFENPSFVHLNNSNLTNNNNNNTDHSDSVSNVGSINRNDEDSYLKENSEIVVLRYKEKHNLATSPVIEESVSQSTTLKIDTSPGNLQRFSSFRSSTTSQLSISAASNSPISRIPITSTYNNSSYDTNSEQSCVNNENSRLKPVVSPRPASLSGVSRITRRSSVNSMKPPPPVRRSSSVTPSHNITAQKSPSLSQQNTIMNSSSESLPPPPAYLLDTMTGNVHSTMGNSSPNGNNQAQQIHVAETVKALTDLRHMPASPGILRRVQNQIQSQQQQQQHQIQQNCNLQYSPTTANQNITFISATPNKIENHSIAGPLYSQQSSTCSSSSNDSHNMSYKSPNTSTSQSGIYAQPKVSKMSSFRTQSPNPKQNSGLIAQLNARLGPKQNQAAQQQQQMYHESRNQQHQQHLQQQHQQQQLLQQQQQQLQYNNSMYGQYQQHQQGGSTGNLSNYQQQYYTDGKNNQIYHQNQPQYHYNQNIYVSTNPFITTPRSNYSPSSFGKESPGQYSTTNYQQNYESNKSGSVLNKTSVGFLENLNAKLAEQRLSGKAFAVRNLINSKALSPNSGPIKNPVDQQQPDPRMCHESLMDQIKRGATLKRNRTINDRSAPKIH